MLLSRWAKPKMVWYASYGSNLSEQRFRCCIEGGRVEGNVRHYEPCADPTPPRQVLTLKLPHQLIFAGESSAWTGGVAFIQDQPQATTISRAYLITLEQFFHVVRKENNLPNTPTLPLAAAFAQGRAKIYDSASRYDELVYFGHRGAYPVLTFTAANPEALNPPAPAYLRQIILGLLEMRQSPDQIVSYLQHIPGIAGHYRPSLLRQIVHNDVLTTGLRRVADLPSLDLGSAKG
jgi:hypothetical protein